MSDDLSSISSFEAPDFKYDAYAHYGRNIIKNFHAKLKPSPVIQRPAVHEPVILRSIRTSAIHPAVSDAKRDAVGTVGILGAGKQSSSRHGFSFD